jgi:two-component system cell cycle response regulator CpdR
MTGIELAHAARRQWPDLTILLMTGYAEQREAAEDLMRIIVGVVDKPFTLADIKQRVREALATRDGSVVEEEAMRLYG